MTWRGLLRAAPLGLGAAVMAACSALLLANMAVEGIGHKHMKLVPGLAGTVLTQKPRWSVQGVMDGSSQAAFARDIGSRMPFYPWAVRLRSEAEWQLLGSTSVPGLVMGSGGVLTEWLYAVDWCTRDIAAWRPGAVAWAGRIRAMQDDIERRGHVFLYVLTPSKVAQYPEILPRDFTCPSTAADRTGWLPAWRAILQDAGVHVADAAGAVSAAHDQYPFPLYPSGGTHWNAAGAAVGQAAVLAALDRLLPGQGLAPEPFTWTMQPRAMGNDVDLVRLMNLFSHAMDGPAPAVTVQHAPPPSPCQPPHVVIVGGSFGHSTVEALSRLPCRVPVVEYEYWSAATIGWDGVDITIRHGVDALARDAGIVSADVLIYEENEQAMRDPAHGRALWQFLQRRTPS